MFWSISNPDSGSFLGVYQADTVAEAVAALNRAAGASPFLNEGVTVRLVDPAELLEERAEVCLADENSRHILRGVAESGGQALVFTHPGSNYYTLALSRDQDPVAELHSMAAECWPDADGRWPLDDNEYPAFVVDWRDGSVETFAGESWRNSINILAAD